MSDAWDGRPENPEREQVAWLRCGEHEPIAALWCCVHRAWFLFDGGAMTSADEAAASFAYLGPCLTPADVAAREAAAWREEREACAVIASELERASRATQASIRKHAGPGQTQDWNSLEGRYYAGHAAGAAEKAGDIALLIRARKDTNDAG